MDGAFPKIGQIACGGGEVAVVMQHHEVVLLQKILDWDRFAHLITKGMTGQQRGGWMVVDVIQAPAKERKSFFGQVNHRRREIQLAIEPGLHRMLIGRRDVGQMIDRD